MSQRGFSLLEVLVAFSILALSLGVLMQIFSGALNNAGVSRDQEQALLIAQSLLAGAGVEAPLAAGETGGRHGDRFDWQLSVTRFDTGQSGARAAGPVPAVELWRVSARVAWGGDARAGGRAVTLETLRAQRKASPQ